MSLAALRTPLLGFVCAAAAALSTGEAGAQQALPSFVQVRTSHQPSNAQLLDRHGEWLAELRFDPTTQRGEWLTLNNMPLSLREALLAAEDKRFFEHDGIDWLAIAGAAWQNLWNHTQRGASTLTMQLAGLLDPALRMPNAPGARRSVTQKWDQGVAAVALEKHWSKAQILEAYLNLAPFRGDLQGVSAASEAIFGLPARALSRKEACILAALLRGPNARPALVAKRACLLADKLGDRALCNDITPLALTRLEALRVGRSPLALHLARLTLKHPGQRISTNLDATLQRKLLDELKSWGDPNVAALVLDNTDGSVLAWVGSTNLTQPDGVSLRRTLPEWSWPQLTALALERRQFTAASPLSDPLAVWDARDARALTPWHSVRTALSTHQAGSMRQLWASLGRDAVNERLRALGVDPADAGEAAPELNLAQLAASWRALAANGAFVAPRILPTDNGVRTVLRADAAFIVLDMLGQARSSGWDALWIMSGKAPNETVMVGSTDRFTLALSTTTPAYPHATWLTLLRALGADTGHPPQAPEGLQQSLIYFDPADEAPRREWFIRGTEQAGLITYLPGRRARILQPQADSERVMTQEEGERWSFSAQASAPVHWMLDGRPLGEGGRAEWEPRPGYHRLSLYSAGDELLDSVNFLATLPPASEP